jgi:hypothetical protein
MTATFLLVHSPIVGPDTWALVAHELVARGHHALVPELPAEAEGEFWRAHVEAIADAAATAFPAGTAMTVVAHSGAGQLLGPLAGAMPQRGITVDAYVMADAGLPTRGASRMEQLRTESPEFADELEAVFAAGGHFPQWSDEQLAGLVGDAQRRRRLREGLRPLPRAYWTEPIPDNPHWPDAPCGVLLFSAGYEPTAAAAHAAGWPVRDLQADNHFLALADPGTVTDELVMLRDAMAP